MELIPPALTNIPTIVTPDGKLIVNGRIANVRDLVAAYSTFWWADLESSRARTVAQQMRDGAAPFSIEKERLLGIGGRANVNWGLAETICEQAEMPYSDLLEGIDDLCTVPTNYGMPDSRNEWESVMADELTLMLRSWPLFYNLWKENVRLFVNEGVSFAFFDDDVDWRWSVRGLQHFKFPRRTTADINSMDMVTAKIDMLPYRLYEHTKNPDIAEKEGWNVPEIENALKQAATQYAPPAYDPEEWEKAYKNYDFMWTATNIVVPTIHGWTREVDGTVTHQICRADGQGKFLYEKKKKYRNMGSMLVAYLYGVGTNGDLHSIRGVLQKNFNKWSAVNKLFCRSLDLMMHSSTPHIACPNADAGTELPFTYQGYYCMVQDGYTFLETKVPDFASALLPGLNFVMQLAQGSSAQYVGGGFSPPGSDRKSGEQISLEAEMAGKLSTNGMILFAVSWRQHVQELVRRICREGYSSLEPGGAEVSEFRARCMNRGVPEEAINQVDFKRVEVNMGIGKGSAMERKRVLAEADRMFYRLDPAGQNRLTNWEFSSLLGARAANQLVPITPDLRPPLDLEFANLENNQLVQGMTVQVLPNQNHEVHLESHLGEMANISDQADQMMITEEQAVQSLEALFAHSSKHLALLDPANPAKPELKQNLEQFNQAIINGTRHIAAKQKKMQDEMAHNDGMVGGQQMEGGVPHGTNGNGAGKIDTGFAIQASQAAQQNRDFQAAHFQKIQQNAELFQQKLTQNDEANAQKLSFETAKQSLKRLGS